MKKNNNYVKLVKNPLRRKEEKNFFDWKPEINKDINEIGSNAITQAYKQTARRHDEEEHAYNLCQLLLIKAH